jgi:GNAT superfamily N-acetyltransferase
MNISIRPLTEDDLPGVDVVRRVALGTLFGLPKPIEYGGDSDVVRTRWISDPSAAFVADVDGKPVGSIFAAKWGSVAIVGPLTVHPKVWDHNIGTRLLEPTMQLLERWGPSHAGMHSAVHSPKHIRLFRKFGFWTRCLIEVMSKPVEETRPDASLRLFSELSAEKKDAALPACLSVTESVYPGLDVSREIRAVDAQGLGDTALFYDDGELYGFAVCHWGPGSEAGTGRCYVKFGAVRRGAGAGAQFQRMLRACEVLAASRGASRLVAGINCDRHDACRLMIAHGFRTESVGVAMHRPYKPAYNRNDVYVIDDWR